MQKANAVITGIIAVLALASWAWIGKVAFVQWSVQPAYLFISLTLTFCACVGWVLLNIAAWRRDNETRCRQCGHILRGLSEPRCPECGTAI